MEILLLNNLFLKSCYRDDVMAILELKQIDEFDDFETGWNKLLSKSLDNNPFLTYEWLTSWGKHIGKDREIKMFTSEGRRGITLAVPMKYFKQRILGLEYCQVSFATSPDSDYQCFLVENLQEASKNIGQVIKNIIEDANADFVVFSDVPKDSATATLLENVDRKNLVFHCTESDACSYIQLPYTYETFRQSLSRKMRKTLKVTEKKALKDYKVDFVKYCGIEPIKEAMDIFFKLHQKRQSAKGNYGVFSNEVYRDFHIEVANAFAKKGWLALFFLTFDNKPVSTIYAFQYHGKLYAYLSGFDTEYADYRPGFLIMEKMIQYAISKNLREIDFMRGEEQYKNRWTTSIRKNYEYQFSRRGLKSKFYNWGINSPCCSALYGRLSHPIRLLQKS